MESTPCKQGMGDKERLPCPGAPQGPAWFQHGMHINMLPGIVLYNNPEKQSHSVCTLKVEMIHCDRMDMGCKRMRGVKDDIKYSD